MPCDSIHDFMTNSPLWGGGSGGSLVQTARLLPLEAKGRRAKYLVWPLGSAAREKHRHPAQGSTFARGNHRGRNGRHKSPAPEGAAIGFHNTLTHSRRHLITDNDCGSPRRGTSFSGDSHAAGSAERSVLRLRKGEGKKKKHSGRWGQIKSGPLVPACSTLAHTCGGNGGIKTKNRGGF